MSINKLAYRPEKGKFETAPNLFLRSQVTPKSHVIGNFFLLALILSSLTASPLLMPALAQKAKLDEKSVVELSSLKHEKVKEGPVVSFDPILLGTSGSSIQLISAPSLKTIGKKLVTEVKSLHSEYASIFGNLIGINNSLRLIDANEFYALTKLPSWTNAMFFRKQIVIPIDSSSPPTFGELKRSLRHEYLHAIIHSLSGGKCPGWLDEGLAQDIEGESHSSLWTSLSSWLKQNRMIPFEKLNKGFTKLPAKMVAPAYAQSLVAARMVRAQFGLMKVRQYLENLAVGKDGETAFSESFGIPSSAFYERVRRNLESQNFKSGIYR